MPPPGPVEEILEGGYKRKKSLPHKAIWLKGKRKHGKKYNAIRDRGHLNGKRGL